MNTTTAITLNDRFSSFKPANGIQQAAGRGRSRSRSRGPARQTRQSAAGSRRNRQILDALEKQHKMRLALKLKNKSIVRSRGRVQAQIIRGGQAQIIRGGPRRINQAAIRKAVNVRNLKRSNSLTTFVPLNDGPGRNFRGRSRSRSRSRNRAQLTGTIADRLGVRPVAGRGRMRRGQVMNNGAQQQRSRSRPRSRVRLNRNNFGNNNNVVNNNRGASRQRNGVANNRSQSRNMNARSQSRNRNGNARSQSRNRNGNGQALARRANPVNARLGNNQVNQVRRRRRFASNTRNPNTQLKKPLTGRIAKRNPRKPLAARVQGNFRRAGNAVAGNARRGNPAKRGAANGKGQAQARGRAQNRGTNAQAVQGAGRRGRSRTRRGANNSNRGGGKGQVSKEQLDKQLDAYMSKGSA